MHKSIRTEVLEIGYQESGPSDGPAVILLHGWPSDVHDWDAVAPVLAAQGWRVLVPWLRGFGPTRFLRETTPRSGQQAALGADLRDFMDGLKIDQAMLAGYDWGGRAACVVSALWPQRVRGLVSVTGYNLQDIAASGQPDRPENEHRLWYQWYFNTERGRAGIIENRNDIARLLWQLWSPNWRFSEAAFFATATSFENPDFAEVTIQSYRHRYANAAGDPSLEAIEDLLATQLPIPVPSIVLHGKADGVSPPKPLSLVAPHFAALTDYRIIADAGHFLPREVPSAIIDAIRDLATN